MHTRCTNKKHPKFRLYGGRGIAVCARWKSFEAFLADMGERPVGTTLDRVDRNGNYEPGNCRWATDGEQNRNRSTNVHLTFRGDTLTVAEWARRLGLLKSTIRGRLKAGWIVEDALSVPVRAKAPNGAGETRSRLKGVPIQLVVRAP